MEKIKGGVLMAFVSTTSANTKSIAFATNHTLNIQAQLADTSNKDEGGGLWGSQDVQLFNWTIDSENFYSYDGEGANYDDLFDMMIGKDKLTLKFAKRAALTGETDDSAYLVPTSGWSVDTTKPYYEGQAIISTLNLTAQNGDYSKYTVTFQGIGPLTKKTPTQVGG